MDFILAYNNNNNDEKATKKGRLEGNEVKVKGRQIC